MKTNITPLSKAPLALVAFAAILSLPACDNMNTTQQRTLSGGAIGAGVGTAATVITGGCVACGAAVGGVVGAGGGYVYDQIQKENGHH